MIYFENGQKFTMELPGGIYSGEIIGPVEAAEGQWLIKVSKYAGEPEAPQD